MAEPVSLEDLLAALESGFVFTYENREAARRLKALAELHQPSEARDILNGIDQGALCLCGKPLPCPDSILLNGGEVPKS